MAICSHERQVPPEARRERLPRRLNPLDSPRAMLALAAYALRAERGSVDSHFEEARTKARLLDLVEEAQVGPLLNRAGEGSISGREQ